MVVTLFFVNTVMLLFMRCVWTHLNGYHRVDHGPVLDAPRMQEIAYVSLGSCDTEREISSLDGEPCPEIASALLTWNPVSDDHDLAFGAGAESYGVQRWISSFAGGNVDDPALVFCCSSSRQQQRPEFSSSLSFICSMTRWKSAVVEAFSAVMVRDLPVTEPLSFRTLNRIFIVLNGLNQLMSS